ncbi:MAG: DNA translocase FtsK [Christensenellales bacterium]
MLGVFGLFFYPICIFFITIGILLVCNKHIKASKSIIVFSCAWLFIFVLILQMATSKGIDIDFGTYITNTFKYSITAGGVIFGTILYPIYYLTHTVATYIILIVALVIISAFLIDKIRLEVIFRNSLKVSDTSCNADKNTEETEDIDTQVEELAIDNSQSIDESDDDIFISDEEDEQKEEAKAILGLSKERTIKDLDTIIETAEKTISNQNIIDNKIEQKSANNRPNIIVHEEGFDSYTNKLETRNEKTPYTVKNEKELKEEERKKAALDYLKISKGKFEAKAMPKGLDNVKDENLNTTEINNQFKSQTTDNNDRLSKLNNLTQRAGLIDNNELQIGVNPFKQKETTDLYDENLTRKSFNENREQYANYTSNQPQSITINNTNFVPKKAQEIYSGEVNENIVDAKAFRPTQVSMNDPVIKPKPTQKIYKKPPQYVRPPIDLLKKFSSTIEDEQEYINQKGELIVKTLKNFKLDAKVINAVKGPTFTRYELQMAPGISVNSVTNKVNDLSMVLESSCRFQIPILGKNAFGIEVPNKKRVTVGLRDIIESPNFQQSKSPLTFALGKDIAADCKVSTIDKLVHTLIAGSTGSGKSVCLNSMLVSLLYKASPDEMKLLLVDPKTVEFSMFNNLPHMLIPNTITECDKAISALNWLVDEMERRYRRLNSVYAKNIEGYNESPEVLSGALPKMYYIVMVFDEVGDFMMVAKKEIEEKVIRLAAKSRACGIHLILATQRPTVDVITGTIKANLPSRIAFAVNSIQDSRTILESSGAESLLGMGDMLFLPKGSNDMERIQCCYVSDEELRSVIQFVKDNNECDFDGEIEEQMFNKKDDFDPTSHGVEDAFDPMLKDCLRYFIKAKKASASSLQGYFGIGYPKANKIVLQMEKAGFVSAGDNNGRRTLFITQQEFEERFGESLDE